MSSKATPNQRMKLTGAATLVSPGMKVLQPRQLILVVSFLKRFTGVANMPLNATEKGLAAAIGFDEDVCVLVKQHAGGPLNRLRGFGNQTTQEDSNGLSVAVKRDQVESIVDRLQQDLVPRGYRAFWSEIYKSNGAKQSDEIAVIKSADEFEIIRLRQANGGNYGVETQDVIQKLESWRNRCNFEVVGAGGSWVALRFATLPPNLCAFAEEIYEFCPDTVEQGVGLKNEADDPESFKAARQLCPKLSEEMQRKLDQQKVRFQAMAMPPALRASLESGAGGFTTPTDMGIRLLAYELKQSHHLFLWWD